MESDILCFNGVLAHTAINGELSWPWMISLPHGHVDSSLRSLAGQAEGFGRFAIGGLHCPVYHVTTLADGCSLGDYDDRLIDITWQSTDITVSRCHFSSHDKTMLIGAHPTHVGDRCIRTADKEHPQTGHIMSQGDMFMNGTQSGFMMPENECSPDLSPNDIDVLFFSPSCIQNLSLPSQSSAQYSILLAFQSSISPSSSPGLISHNPLNKHTSVSLLLFAKSSRLLERIRQLLHLILEISATMKQLHKQTSVNHRSRDEEMAGSHHSTPPCSPKVTKHPRSLPRSIHYFFREQRLLFVLVGILIGYTFFILQPSLSCIGPHETNTHAPLSIPSDLSDSSSSSNLFSVVDQPRYRPVGRVPAQIGNRRKRIVVTGGAGFVGSHLVDKLIARGDDVIGIDNFFTGRRGNVVHHFGNPRFELIRHDVVDPILLEVDEIYHLACPASPVHYKYNPIKTIISFVLSRIFLLEYCRSPFSIPCSKMIPYPLLDYLWIENLDIRLYKTNVMGTLNMLGLAKRIGARFLLTSTSDVYGDPLEHPQKETYWGHVNPIGVRSCYDEGKRTAETLTMDYHRGAGVEVRIARIFNTYGPRMCLDDGRVVSNFVAQAIRKQPLTVYGDGLQTRSFQYVSDLVDGLVALMEGEHVGPFNLGNPGEFTMLELAEVVKETIDPSARIEFKSNTEDDPHKRKPDITKAKELLNWEPKISLREGLPRMVSDFRSRMLNEDEGKGL
ncbi:hypothetical protein SAY86_005885 [Trapa natans]|uniref:UDP-glucuronate decarboxylase n=1 Tax=Trapa natans TaxID=22666 RepID=A0AAN7QSX4_TRANT|nr:hypothetical protein SAY86_005885 [Trapa natans]